MSVQNIVSKYNYYKLACNLVSNFCGLDFLTNLVFLAAISSEPWDRPDSFKNSDSFCS